MRTRIQRRCQYMRDFGRIARRSTEIRVLYDSQRDNRLVVFCPRLEEWLVQSAKSSGLKMTDFGFGSDNGRHLHGEINERLPNVKRLVGALLSAKNLRILHLQSLI